MTEDDGGDVVKTHLESWLVVEDAFCHKAALSNGDWSEIHLVGDITDGIDTRNVCVLVFVDFDRIFFDDDTSIFQLQWVKICWSSQSAKDLMCLDICSI